MSYHIGYAMASNIFRATMMGGMTGFASAVIFFVATVAVGALIPDTFDGRSPGAHFLVLLPVAPILSSVIAVLGHRHPERVEARRLPF